MDRDFKIVIVNRDREFSSDRGPNRIVIVNRNRDREFSSDRGELFLLIQYHLVIEQLLVGSAGFVGWPGWAGWEPNRPLHRES